MAATASRRALTLALACILPVIFAQEYEIPNVSIQALSPSGVRISIPDNPRITLFAFQGNINRAIQDNDVGTISAEVSKPKNGFWTFQDDDVSLKVGDVIQYYVHVVRNTKGYHKDNLSHTVTEIIDPDAPAGPKPVVTRPPLTSGPVVTSSSPAPNCRPTATEVREGTVCAGQIIFEDNFDNLREDVWRIEQYIPSRPEYLFVSYQRPPNVASVRVENGVLRIEPKLQEEVPGFEATAIRTRDLDLMSGCTKPRFCQHINNGPIMPPIASGRISSQMFAFKYGIVEVRAKLPQGDWLYPDILLESLFKKYGDEDYHSGVLRIAGARGNIELTKGSEDYGNKVLYGGPMMDFKCRSNLLARKESTAAWGDDFHVYTLRWEAEKITLLVDGEEWGRMSPAASGFQARLPYNKCDPPRALLSAPNSPFDDFFHITFGVAVGGVAEFPDGIVTQQTIPKPWTNGASKARLQFYRDINNWKATWNAPALVIDYVKVRAL